jgi:hypothetical protein
MVDAIEFSDKKQRMKKEYFRDKLYLPFKYKLFFHYAIVGLPVSKRQILPD